MIVMSFWCTQGRCCLSFSADIIPIGAEHNQVDILQTSYVDSWPSVTNTRVPSFPSRSVLDST